MIGSVNEERLRPANAQMKCNGGEPAQASGKDCDRQKPLPFRGHAKRKPIEKTNPEALKAGVNFHGQGDPGEMLTR
jgi:hypothetical protein